MAPTDLEAFRGLKFEGGRFEQPGLPVTVMAEIITYQDLVLRAAKAVFFREHPFRQRLPKGFKDRYQLRLSQIHTGSVATLLERTTNQILEDDEFSEAETHVTNIIRAAASRQSLPTLPGFDLSSVNRLGQTLEPSERIVLHPKTANQAILDFITRHHIAKYTYKPPPRIARLAGRVTEINAAKHTFTLWVNAYSSFCTGSFDAKAHLALLKEVLTEDMLAGPEIAVKGNITFSRDGLPKGWNRLTLLSKTIDERQHLLERLKRQIEEMVELEDTWFDTDSKKPSDAALMAAWDIFRSLTNTATISSFLIPVAFPTPTGGISLEWITDQVDIDINILSSGEQSDFSYWNKETGEYGLEEGVSLSPPKVLAYLQHLHNTST